jgi:cytochrome c biogenesis protein CcmG/thiol:disulfide interchange protein DsbE
MTAVDDRAGSAPDDEDAPRPRVARYIALGVGVVLVLFIALLATRPAASDDSSGANALVGKRVPALSGRTLDDKTVSIDSFRGKWVFVNFVAEWCVACQAENPDLVAFQQAHPDDVQIIGVAFGSNGNDKLRKFFDTYGGVVWPVITSDDGRSAIDFGVTAVPETFAVAPTQFVFAHAEGVSKEWLEDVLAQGKDLQQRADAQASSTTAPAR